MKTAVTARPRPKRKLTAREFVNLKKDFVRDRIEQYQARTGKSWHELNQLVFQPGATEKIDKVVDPEYHSSLMPCSDNYIILQS